MKRNSQGVKLSSQQNKQLLLDTKLAETVDSQIIHPQNLKGKTFSNWTGFWNELNADRDDYMYWYKLEKIDYSQNSAKTTTYLVKCRMCTSEIKIEYSLQNASDSKLKVISLDNVHNHTKLCFENTVQHQRINKAETLSQIEDLFLLNKSYSVFKVYHPLELTSFRTSEILETDIFVSSQSNKKDFIYTVNYDIIANEEKITQRSFKFSPKTKKQLDLISIAFALCDGQYINVPKINIICSYENSKLCNNTWQSQILLSKLDESSTRIYKIIKSLIAKFEKVNFFSQEEQKLRMKPTDTNIKKAQKKEQQSKDNNYDDNNNEKCIMQNQKDINQFLDCDIAPQENNKIQQEEEDIFDFLRDFDSLSN